MVICPISKGSPECGRHEAHLERQVERSCSYKACLPGYVLKAKKDGRIAAMGLFNDGTEELWRELDQS